jgi:GNAT superfamily N-acetyltransferase
MGAGTARVFVVCARGTKRVVAYYALTAGSVGHEDGPPRMYKGVSPHYPVPVVLLTRLAVDTAEQGQGLGKALLVDALRRTIAAADSIGVRCLLVHCRSDEVRAFYLNVIPEFEPSPTDALHLILLMKDLRAAVGRSGPSTGHGGRRE